MTAKEIKEKLASKNESAYDKMTDAEIKTAYGYCEGYKEFLNIAKTEREAVKYAIALAKEKGFKEFSVGEKYNPGDKFYINNRGKAAAFLVIGKKPATEGVNIVAAHVDNPRLDLKGNPLYEADEIGYFKTHYYGGIRKYHWPVTPLALHGVICLKNGESKEIVIGEKEDEPCFAITDLLPHLAQEQNKRTLPQGIKGEELNIVIGSRPFKDDEASEKVKLNLLNLLFEKYGSIEDDFRSAELVAVPITKARDIGFDRSLVGAFGHDDRVCAYPAFTALLETEAPDKTCICVFADKEEIGSEGNTGLQSAFVKYIVDDLCRPYGISTTVALRNSCCLSADVNGAYDPTFADAFEKNNACFINRGVCVTKYTGGGGKYDTSDASAEYVSKVRTILDKGNVAWQIGELGKVDIGGGGTVAKYLARLGMDVIDIGVPVLAMHSPFEIVSKLDIYATYRACAEFFINA